MTINAYRHFQHVLLSDVVGQVEDEVVIQITIFEGNLTCNIYVFGGENPNTIYLYFLPTKHALEIKAIIASYKFWKVETANWTKSHC